MDDVTDDILRLYDKLPHTGKPRDDEYTVLAAFVATSSSKETLILSMATGTKCIGRDMNNSKGFLMSDSHAEVVARRGLIHLLMKQIGSIVLDESFVDTKECIVEPHHESDSTNVFRIKSNWKISLYISDSPCGDAAMYEANLSGVSTVVTGAKAAASAATERIGCLRTKSGRSDISAENRTTSMSCSDKISRWNWLGLQGSLLSLWLCPLFIESVVVDEDPLALENTQAVALRRALVDRYHMHGHMYGHMHGHIYGRHQKEEDWAIAAENDTNTSKYEEGCTFKLPQTCIRCSEVRVSNKDDDYAGDGGGGFSVGFSHGKAVMKSNVPSIEEVEVSTGATLVGKKRRRNPLSPCGFSINWCLGKEVVLSPTNRSHDSGSSSSGSSNNSTHGAVSRKVKSLPVVCGGTVEVTIAHTGCLQGTTKKAEGGPAAASRLSRHFTRDTFLGLVDLCCAKKDNSAVALRMYVQLVKSAAAVTGCLGNVGDFTGPALLDLMHRSNSRDLKNICGSLSYKGARDSFLAHSLFSGWLCDDD